MSGGGGRGMGDDVRKLVADNEAATILSLLEKTSLSNSEGPDAVAAVLAAGLSEGATSDIVFRLGQKLSESAARPTTPGTAAQATPSGPTPGETTPGKAAPGGTVQNFESCLHFFPASVWQNTRTAGSVEPMVNLCLRLGLRKPSPYTCQVLSCASQLHYKGLETCTAMDRASRTSGVHLVAKMVKRKAALLPAPSVWLAMLPATPVDFAAKHLDLFREVYGDDAANHPVQAVISLMDFEMLRTQTRCRHQKGSDATTGPVQVVVPTMPAGLEQFGNCMLEQMNVLAKGIQDLQGNRKLAPTGNLRLESVRAAMMDHSPRPALTDAPSPWALNLAGHDGGGPRVEELSDTGPAEPVAATPVAEPPAAPTAAPPNKKARLSVAEASKLVLEGYVSKDKTAESAAGKTAKSAADTTEAASAGKAVKVSEKPLGLRHRSGGLSSRFLA